MIGEPGLISALYDAGFSMNETNPDFVVVGETRQYTYERIEHAVHLVRKGARLIGTNVDVTDRMHESFIPACGSLIRPIELASGKDAFFVGKVGVLVAEVVCSVCCVFVVCCCCGLCGALSFSLFSLPLSISLSPSFSFSFSHRAYKIVPIRNYITTFPFTPRLEAPSFRFVHHVLSASCSNFRRILLVLPFPLIA